MRNEDLDHSETESQGRRRDSLFIISGSAYLVTLVIFHALVPKLEPARLPLDELAKAG